MQVADNDNLVPDVWSRILKQLNSLLTEPSAAYPNTRWLSGASLRRLLVQARDVVGAPKSISGAKLLASLEACGLATSHRIDSDRSGGSPFIIYCLDVGGEAAISPMELLGTTQSNFEQSVMCYFTALAYHQLTTQMAPHHHVAQLKDYPIREKQSGEGERSTNVPPMGTLLFYWGGIPYYVSRRDRKWVPGIHTVVMSSHFMARVTTLEQTLLDTLHRPWSCGGPPVVFEAWGQGIARLDEDLLIDHLDHIVSPDIFRRVGYMLEKQAYTVSDAALRAGIDNARAMFKAGQSPPVSLLPHVPYRDLDPAWGLFV